MSEHYICIHGQFYQPPRENPWLENVEQEDSALPYHNWNEKVCAECYAPNTASHVLGQEKKIIEILNNYSYMSFSMGPALLEWLKRQQNDIYEKILEADKWSQCHFSGHGSAIAQVYNHIIMPLANSRDKETQIVWGIRDFEFRFGRKPEGMWLAETAVDIETLEILAEREIRFTILAPHQAKRVKKLDETRWYDVSDGRIDPRMPYLHTLPSGRSIAIFFYDMMISHDTAFGTLIQQGGETLAKRLCANFGGSRRPSPLVNIALDGETFGHRHRGGHIPLATCFHYIESNRLAKITVYGEYLEKHSPTYEVEIIPNTSWACLHGVERWRSDCGCNMGNSGWNQVWRAPLRGALDWLRDMLAVIYEKNAVRFFHDPWVARNAYINCILERSSENTGHFFARYAKNNLRQEETVIAIKLLEMQYSCLSMYSSCGWFFDEISCNETVQVLKYASRALQLAYQISNIDLEPAFLKLLERISSNIVHYKNCAKIYELLVKPSSVDLLRIVAHYATSSLFRTYSIHEPISIYTYVITIENYERMELGKYRLVAGRAQVYSQITTEQSIVSFAFLHTGDHNIFGGVRYCRPAESFSAMLVDIKESFTQKDLTKIQRCITRHFGNFDWGLKHVFRDEQRKILQTALDTTFKNLENSFVQIYNHYQGMMGLFQTLQFPLPKPLATTTEFILNRELAQLIQSENTDLARISEILIELHGQSLELDKGYLNFIAQQKIVGMMERIAQNHENTNLVQKLNGLLEALEPCHLQLNLWKAQNIYFSIQRKVSERGGRYPDLQTWLEQFQKLGQYLEVRRR